MLTRIVENFLSKKNLLLGDKRKTLNCEKTNLFIKNILTNISHVEKNVIGIILPRDINYILVILAIWKSGRSFVPLNYNWPLSFINLIIKRSKLKYVITNNENLKIKGVKTIILNKNKIKNKIKNKKINSKVAYTIFTSGSTGEPKGVQISKKAFITYLNWVKKNQKSKKKIRHLITGEITFDIVLADLAFALANKTSIFITDDPKNVFNVLELINKHKINSIYCVPSLMDKVIDAAKALSLEPVKFEFVFCGGDIFKIKLYKKVKSFFKGARIFNMYGPTECTMNSLGVELNKIKNILKFKNLPTGYKFNHLKYLILNENKEEVKEGELFIGGNQLMDGYLSKNQNNLINPFIKIKNRSFYKTGDIFKIDKKLLYFVGRKNQINKLSGFRINFSFIENAVEKLDFINEFKLYIKNDNLYGFYTIKKKTSIVNLKIFFKKKFPTYMIPKKIIKVKNFPYNNRGKINYNILERKI